MCADTVICQHHYRLVCERRFRAYRLHSISASSICVILKTVVIVMAKRFTWADDRLQLEAEMEPGQDYRPVTRPCGF